MTGDLLLDSVISAAGVVVLVGVIWGLFPSHPAPVTREAARERLAFDEPDFEPARWIIDAGGRAALAENGSGEFALVLRLGADLVVRRFREGDGEIMREARAVTVRLPDPSIRPVTLRILEEK